MRTKFLSVLGILLSGVSCAETPENCAAFAGWEQIVDQAPSKIIMFGEMHGTNESPAAVTGVLCELVKTGTPIKFGVEAFHNQSAALNEAVTWPIVSQDLIDAGPDMWTVPDGRSSLAVLGLLEKLAYWRSMGADIEVFAFDSTFAGDDAELTRSNVMAREVDAAARGFEGAVILLTGGYHIRLNSLESVHRGGSLASEVVERPVLVLDMAHEGGEAYVTASFGGGEMVIGASFFNKNHSKEGEPGTFVLSEDDPRKGSYFVGPITASPPAFPDLIED